MTGKAYAMIRAIRKELVTWAIAGAALHWAIKHGFNKYVLGALALTLTGEVFRNRRRTPRPKPLT